MYASLPFSSTKILATLKKCWVLLLSAALMPLVPNCWRNLPSRVNLTTRPSSGPLPPIQTVPSVSTVMPWFEPGQV
jgi:hypothetical protein